MYRQVIDNLRMLFVAPVRLHWVQLAGLGLSAFSTGMSFLGSSSKKKAQKRQAKQEAYYQKLQMEQQTANIQASVEEAEHKAATQIHETTVMMMAQRASVMAGAGEAGVAGASITRTLIDRMHQERTVRGSAYYALDVFKGQAARDLSGADLGLQAATRTFEGVDTSTLALSAGLNFASTALQIGTDASGNWRGFW